MQKLFLFGLASLLLTTSSIQAAETVNSDTTTPATEEPITDMFTMNEDVWAGRWQQLKGHVKENWGALTDDDITEIDGKKDILLGKLRAKYGYTQERAAKEIKDFEKANLDN